MANITRRDLIKTGVLAGATGALAGCAGTGTEASKLPSESDYPISPDSEGAKARWTSEEVARSWIRISNEDGPTLGVADASKIIQVDGLAFKDLNGNGKLDFWEDWRQDPEARAAALAQEMDLADIPGLMVVDGTMSGFNSGTVPDEVKAFLDKGVRGANLSVTDEVKGAAAFANATQAYVESRPNGIPMDYSTDPRNSGWGIGVSPYPDNLACGELYARARDGGIQGTLHRVSRPWHHHASWAPDRRGGGAALGQEHGRLWRRSRPLARHDEGRHERLAVHL